MDGVGRGFTLALTGSALAAPTNPLDALTADEINRTVEILTAARQANPDTRFPTITLLENPKAEVLSWSPGQPFQRRARADYLNGNRLFEADVNLTTGKIDFGHRGEGSPILDPLRGVPRRKRGREERPALARCNGQARLHEVRQHHLCPADRGPGHRREVSRASPAQGALFRQGRRGQQRLRAADRRAARRRRRSQRRRDRRYRRGGGADPEGRSVRSLRSGDEHAQAAEAG